MWCYRSCPTLLLRLISELKADIIEGLIDRGTTQATIVIMTYIAVVHMLVAGGMVAHITVAHGSTFVAMVAPTTEQARPHLS